MPPWDSSSFTASNGSSASPLVCVGGTVFGFGSAHDVKYEPLTQILFVSAPRSHLAGGAAVRVATAEKSVIKLLPQYWIKHSWEVEVEVEGGTNHLIRHWGEMRGSIFHRKLRMRMDGDDQAGIGWG